MGIKAVPLNLQGNSNLAGSNPKSDLFKVNGFHHVEFWCGDATNVSHRFSNGLGMPLVAKSDLTTGNLVHASYLLCSGNLKFLFTSPYSPTISSSNVTAAIPSFDYGTHLSFITTHGLAVRAVALDVDDARAAFDASVASGAKPIAEPVVLEGQVTLAEVQLYGDVVLRYVSHANMLTFSYFLPTFSCVNMDGKVNDFGLMALDHVAGIVPHLAPAIDHIAKITGFHDFGEYAGKEMLQLIETAVDTKFIANNNESVIINLSEPISGTKQNSYAKTFLKHNQGPGVQHVALSSNDIFKTLREIKKRSSLGGFNLMPPPPPGYYKGIREWAGDVLTNEQILECEALTIKVDRDDEGVILQTFTTPIGDRPTLIIEILQRIGCMVEGEDGNLYQKGGCGGFGKGNVTGLVKSIEDYEKTLVLSDDVA